MARLRYQNKKLNLNERRLISAQWREQIEIYGQEVNYYSNKATLDTMHPLYGEDPNSGFLTPKKLVLLLNMNNDSYMLSKFGIVADSDLSGVIHPLHFQALFDGILEPKAGDLLELTEFGEDRLGYPKRGESVYELTEVRDEYELNAIGGHYVWFWKARRYDFSNEPGSPGAGKGNNPVDDNDTIEEKANENFDYSIENPCSNTSVYGDYQ
jgi:hypothetical protein